MTQRVPVDAVIVGGGAAGLWTLDRLVRDGVNAVLLESDALGAGQTVAAQGIIHGGLKYTLDGNVGESARAIADMPLYWRECMRGERMPSLTNTILRADWCSLWRTQSVRSQFGMAGARAALQVRPTKLARADRPDVLARTPGDVFRLNEPVIDPGSMLSDLAEIHSGRLLQINAKDGLHFEATAGTVQSVRLANPAGGDDLDLRPKHVVFTAGKGSGALRRMVGLDEGMQIRPLHMVMVRGNLPVLNGHCTDGARTRTTITTSVDHAGRSVWQVGGQLAEDGVVMEQQALLEHAQAEVAAVLPGFKQDGLEWATYRVDRAEVATSGGKRPSDVWAAREGNVITGWPTKLALAPRLAERVAALIGQAPAEASPLPAISWPAPAVALPPWEREVEWFADR